MEMIFIAAVLGALVAILVDFFVRPAIAARNERLLESNRHHRHAIAAFRATSTAFDSYLAVYAVGYEMTNERYSLLAQMRQKVQIEFSNLDSLTFGQRIRASTIVDSGVRLYTALLGEWLLQNNVTYIENLDVDDPCFLRIHEAALLSHDACALGRWRVRRRRQVRRALLALGADAGIPLAWDPTWRNERHLPPRWYGVSLVPDPNASGL